MGNLKQLHFQISEKNKKLQSVILEKIVQLIRIDDEIIYKIIINLLALVNGVGIIMIASYVQQKHSIYAGNVKISNIVVRNVKLSIGIIINNIVANKNGILNSCFI